MPGESDLLLRPAVSADAAALAALGRKAFVAKFGHLYSADNLARFLDESHSVEQCAREIADQRMAIMLAERAGTMAGMCKLKLDSTLKEHGTARKSLEIKQLYTDPDQTGGGIGTALMDWAMEFAQSRGADEVQLSVWSENFGAQRFYARYGFTKVADIAFWVGDHRDDEFLFARQL